MKRSPKILYLDQFAASNMSANKGIWSTAKELVETAVCKGKIICPIPMEHYVETSGRSIYNAIEHHDWFKSVSGRKQFFPWEIIVANEIMNWTKRRINKRYTPNYLTSLRNDIDFTCEEAFNIMNEARLKYHELVNQEKKNLNEIRNYIRTKGQKHNHDHLLIKALNNITCQNFAKEFKATAYGKKYPSSIMEIGHKKEERIAYLLCLKHFTCYDFMSIANDIINFGFEHIPSLNIYYKMKFYFSLENIEEKANDDIDIERISSGLYLSDIMFVDYKQKIAIEKLGLDKKYNTIIYSAKQDDIKLFVEYMRDI